MSQVMSPHLYVLAPQNIETDCFIPVLKEACTAGNVASLLLPLPDTDMRAQINFVKTIAPVAQTWETAVLLSGTKQEELIAVALRGGADGIHINRNKKASLKQLRQQLGSDYILGVGGLFTKDDAMFAGEFGADYLMFGEKTEEKGLPNIEEVREQTAWWAEIFEVPCVAYAPTMAALEELAATGVDFIAVDDLVWKYPTGTGAAVADINSVLAKYTVAE